MPAYPEDWGERLLWLVNTGAFSTKGLEELLGAGHPLTRACLLPKQTQPG